MSNILNKLDKYIVVIDYNGDIVDINNKLIEKLKYDYNSIIKSNIKDVVFDEDNIIDKIINTKDKITLDIKLKSKIKKIIELHCNVVISIYKNKKCIFLVCSDITDKYYKKEDLEILLDKTPFITWIKNKDGVYLYTNKKYKSYYSEEFISLIGKTDFDLMSEEMATIYHQTDQEVINTMKNRKDEYKYKDNKDIYHFETSKYPIMNEDGTLKYIVGIVKDVSVERNLENQITKNHYNLSKLYEMIDKNKKDIKLQNLVEELMEELKNHLNANGMSLLLYDEEKNILVPTVNLGASRYGLEDIEYINHKKGATDKNSSDYYEEGIKEIDEINGVVNRDGFKRLGSKYIGTYYINVDKEFIGILNISYKEGNNPVDNIDKFMKTMALEIGMLIKKFRLSINLQDILKKRKLLEEELELFLLIATDLVSIFDEKGVVKIIDTRLSNIMKLDADEFIYMKAKQILKYKSEKANDERKAILKNKKEILNVIKKYESDHGGGKYIDYKVKYLPDRKEYIVIGRDITQDKINEKERKKLEESVRLEAIKNKFFANISHEFNTPINIILGNMQLLNRSIEEEEIKYNKNLDFIKYVNSIKQNSYRLLRLVNNLIDMTRIDTGFYNIDLCNYDIVKVVEDITLSVAQYTEAKGIKLIFDTNIEELTIACDPDKIERIMLNLLSNAIKYSKFGGEIFVELKYISNKVSISVRDSGIGISNEKIKLIFERFGQSNDSLIDRCQGSGIGLSLVRSLVELHEGKIYVDSKEGEGSTFKFELPNRVINTTNKKQYVENYSQSRVEKCDIEFSEIYS